MCAVSCVKPIALPDRWDDVTPIPGHGEMDGSGNEPAPAPEKKPEPVATFGKARTMPRNLTFSSGAVRVTDNGVSGHDAIDPFDEFESGFGLALPIARRVLEADGGAIARIAGVTPLALVAELPAHT